MSTLPAGKFPANLAGKPIEPEAATPVIPVSPAVASGAPMPVQVVKSKSEVIPELRVYGHSMLFYWWPVWVTGFVMAALTYSEGSRAAIVPEGANYDRERNVVVLPSNATLTGTSQSPIGELSSDDKNLGVVFTVVLLLVIFITHTPLRGLWSGIVVLFVLLVTVTFAWMGWWPDVLRVLGRISIHMNMGFYMLFSTILFVFWAGVFFGFDRMRYWKFRSGQVTYESVWGGGQKSYDTNGMLFEKLRDDPFRHWLLGMGSGDLIINTSGAQRERIEIPNVLLVDGVLVKLQKLISEKPN